MSVLDLAGEQQHRAADPAASVWVSASAGTGKTHVLTERILRLLLAGTAPERILCLTFTKAAAAEMANRLHERLGAWAMASDDWLAGELEKLTGAPPDGAERLTARRLFAQVLEARGGLKIQTIHSFCESLLRRFPLEAGLQPNFQVMDDRLAEERLQDAFEAVYRQEAAGTSRLLSALTALVDEESLARLARSIVGERARFERLWRYHGGIPGLIAAVRDVLELVDGEDEAAILAAAAEEAAFDGTSLRRVARAMIEAKGVQDNDRGAAMEAWLAMPGGRTETFDAYVRGFLTDKGQPYKNPCSKAVKTAHPDAEDILQAEAERIMAVQERRRRVQTAKATAALLQFGWAVLEAYGDAKHRHAVLDYDDLILKTRDLLSSSESTQWVLYKLDGGLDHILVDEAQDTNAEQWQVIRALADEFFGGEGAREDRRTIFVVGDAKQSIYSFQRADPDAYVAMRDYFHDRVTASRENWRDVSLNRSFRSVATVLDAVDAVFEGAEAVDGLQFGGEAAIRHVTNRIGEAGLVELWEPEAFAESEEREAWLPPVEQESADLPVQRLAVRVATTIREWVTKGEILASKGRPMRPGDILVLVQKRAPFVEALVRELKRGRVPVAGVDRMVLTEQLAVMDLIALGRFLLLPEDDLTLATVLKSPLCNFDDDDLLYLARGREGSLWRALGERRHGRGHFEAAHAELSALLARADYVPPFELYAELLGARRGRHRLLRRLGPDANDPIDEFLGLALQFERDHPPSLQAFLHWLEAGETEVKRDQEQRRDEVRVMTVHGAKGLQAPVVFLADTCRFQPSDATLYWPDDDGGAPLWRPHGDLEVVPTATAKERLRRRQLQEHHRLLYVALTRAADRLYVCGFEGKRGRAEGCWYDLIAGALAGRMEEIEIEPGLKVRRLSALQTAAPKLPGAVETEVRTEPLPAWATRPAATEERPPRPLAPSRPEGEEAPVLHPLDGRRGRRLKRGTLVHRLLQALPELPAGDRRAAGERFLALPAHGLAPQDRAELLGEVLAILEAPELAPLFGPGSAAEVPVAGVVGTTVIAGQIDRLVVGTDEIVIADFKTNRPPPWDAADVAPLYLRQMAAYRALLQGIYPGRPVRCLLIWTDGARAMALPEAALDAHAPATAA